MRITFISDTHTYHDYITKFLTGGEVLVHAGDMTSRGYAHELEGFLKWYDELPYTHKIFIAGNHDFIFQDHKQAVKDILAKYPNITYLENSEVVIEGVKFWGSPYTPRFFDWAFNVDRGEDIREHWLQIPLDTDVLITHGPPMGILDRVMRDNSNVGCEELMDVIKSQLQIKAHVFGHIHEGYGTYVDGATTYINASSVNLAYRPVNHPITIDL